MKETAFYAFGWKYTTWESWCWISEGTDYKYLHVGELWRECDPVGCIKGQLMAARPEMFNNLWSHCNVLRNIPSNNRQTGQQHFIALDCVCHMWAYTHTHKENKNKRDMVKFEQTDKKKQNNINTKHSCFQAVISDRKRWIMGTLWSSWHLPAFTLIWIWNCSPNRAVQFVPRKDSSPA